MKSTDTKGDPDRQSAEFYVSDNDGHEVVWANESLSEWCVIRAGEMKTYYIPDEEEEVVIRYTSDLSDAGIVNDTLLEEMFVLGEPVWTSVFNPWFEVTSDTAENGQYDHSVFDTLDEAIAYAISLGRNKNSEEPDLVY